MKMYDQMFADINRHILVVWQSLGVLLSAVALFALVDKGVITLDIAATIFVVISAWSVLHALEAGYWYNRGLAIIANIERQFLRTSDLQDIHYYFGSHRSDNKLLDQLRNQIIFAAVICLVFLTFHFHTRVEPGIHSPWSCFEWPRALPYVCSLAVIIYTHRHRKKLDQKYAEFIENSPGIWIDTSKVKYGIGHGGKGKNQSETRSTSA